MRFEKVWVALLALTMSLVGECLAARAYPHPLVVKNPDGSEVVIRKVGDEKLHYTVSEDGELIARDSLGFWNYADESGKPTGVRMHKRDKRGDAEKKFLEKRNSKEVLQKFLKKKREKMKVKEATVDTASAVLPLLKAAPLRAGALTAIDSVLEVATRPSFKTNMTMGEGNVLVVLVEFSDVKFKSSNPQQTFHDYMNKEGYSENGMRWSVRDYFVQNSMGQLKPTFDVAAPVTLSQSQAYYGANDRGDLALNDAIKIIKSRGDVNFSKYDRDGDRNVDYVYMIYAGVGEADTQDENAIWPHASETWIDVGGGYRIRRYACSGELNGPLYVNNQGSTVLAGMGVVVHEYSHVLGLPDFYDTQDTTGQNYTTPYIWSLMDMGEYNTYPNATDKSGSAPPRMTGFERFSLGWLTPRILRKVNGKVTLRGVDQNEAILIPTSKKDEYFILDYHAKYDNIAPLPNSGLMVWRIGYNANAWYNNVVNTGTTGENHRMNYFRADNDAGFATIRQGWFTYYAPTLEDTNLKGDVFPGYKNVKEFKGFVSFSGEDIGLRIYDITEHDSSVTFMVEWDNPDPNLSYSEEESSSSALPPSSSSVAPPSSSSAVVPPSSSSNAFGLSSSSTVPPSSSSFGWPFRSSSSTVVLPEVASLAGSLRVEAGVLYVNVPVAGKKVLRVFDVHGHLVQTSEFFEKATSLNLGALPRGSYIVRVESGGNFLKKGVVRL